MTQSAVAHAESYTTLDAWKGINNVRKAFATVKAIGPLDGTVTVTGTMLVWRQFDGTGLAWSYQHVSGGGMRCVRTELDGLTRDDTAITPLETDRALADHLRSLVVEILR